MSRPIVLLHGYSANSTAFAKWKEILENHYRDVIVVHTASYKSLTNEITIKDIAEAFDRVLRITEGLGNNEEFDAIVHSTGMLVIRAWLTTYAADVERRKRLKRLIGLAPATFGSPLAHKGRSWLGSIFQGLRNIGNPDQGILEPDFLEAGNLILDSLELGSRFTWDLAHLDLIGPTKDKPENKPYYGKDNTTPYVFICCGNKGYDGISEWVNTPGSDGTVRWAGCALNTRKFIVDLTQDPSRTLREAEERAQPEQHSEEQIDIPLVLVKDKDHGTIMSDPSQPLIDLVLKALKVTDEQSFNRWNDEAKAYMNTLDNKWEEWQQFIIRVVDERLDPVTDWNVQFFIKENENEFRLDESFGLHVHSYSGDKSLRCFHVNLSKLNPERLSKLTMRLIASSGTRLVSYYGCSSEKIRVNGMINARGGTWDAQLDLTHLLKSPQVKFFCPFTTTLVEFRLNREPFPIGQAAKNEILRFEAWP